MCTTCQQPVREIEAPSLRELPPRQECPRCETPLPLGALTSGVRTVGGRPQGYIRQTCTACGEVCEARFERAGGRWELAKVRVAHQGHGTHAAAIAVHAA